LWLNETILLQLQILGHQYHLPGNSTDISYDVGSKLVLTMEVNMHQAEVLVKEYLLADELITWTSVLSGIVMCKMVFFLNFSSSYEKLMSEQ
jgi:hypothetical protein